MANTWQTPIVLQYKNKIQAVLVRNFEQSIRQSENLDLHEIYFPDFCESLSITKFSLSETFPIQS